MVETKCFTAYEDDCCAAIAEAAAILRGGGLVAVPTETVYGLGANGLDAAAVGKIFDAKGRPQDNPLILHLPELDWLPRYCRDIPPAAWELGKRFWPGPLTMILPRREIVPDVTCAGLDGVGLRVPDCNVTRAIIRAADVPMAAPSANRSGRPSCTTAQHVLDDMQGRIDAVVDGGACSIGVESTIVDMCCTPPRLLRPGGVTLAQLREVLGEVEIDRAVVAKMQENEKPRAPGMKYRHYAPRAALTVVEGPPRASACAILAAAQAGDGVLLFDEWRTLYPHCHTETYGASDDLGKQAQNIFDALRRFDATDVPHIYAQCPQNDGIGLAVRNRLCKAAGFRTIQARSPFVIGLTGGTGAGKTCVLWAMEQLGACIIDCDAFYYQQLRENAAMRSAIEEAFGAVFLPSGDLDRKKLGMIVFDDRAQLARLDAITRRYLPPAIARAMQDSDAALIGLDAIKLIESGLSLLCDVTVAVTADEETRIARIMRRDGIEEEYARARVRAQKDTSFYRENCDCVFVNDGTDEAEALRRATELIRALCADNGRTEGQL